ncbi:MAG: beta-galactosidase [Phycisphaeraceae bacterium]
MRRRESLRVVIGVVVAAAMASGAAGTAGAAGGAETAGEGWVWIEGEHAADHDLLHHDWYDDVDKSIMSGEQWLSHYGNRAGEALYRFDSPGAGRYILWMRANYFRVSMAYRLGDEPWRELDVSDRRDEIMISSRPDHRFLGWIRVGELTLGDGRHELAVRIASELSNHGGIDAIVLAGDGFVPTGTRTPGARHEAGPDVWFPVLPADDAFSDASVIDLAHLNHARAGERGRLMRDGDALRFDQDDEPTRFWGVGGNVAANMSADDLAQRARYLRKHGVNIVRQHTLFGFLGPLEGGQLNPQRLDQFDRWFATLKDHGIYHHWSVFYPLIIAEDDGYPPGLFAELDNGRTYGLVNMSRQLQDLQLAYVEALLEHVNPYTGQAYRDDPALAVIEVHNEDSIFFHSPLNQLAQGDVGDYPEHARLLRRRFRDWAHDRYDGSTAALREAWGTRDTFDDDEFAIYAAWQMTSDGPRVDEGVDSAQQARMGDFIRFLTAMQRGYYERRVAELRDLGYDGLVITTAWRAGGPAADPANLYADAVGDAISRHNYIAGHEGRHRIETGRVSTFTHLDRAGSGLLATGMYQVEHLPFGMTEWGQTVPNPYKAEAAPLVAFYGLGLQGWDFSYHFNSDASATRLGDGWPGLNWYRTDTPHYMGQFPALALAVREGHNAQAPLAAARRHERHTHIAGVDPLAQNFTGGGWDQKELVGDEQTPAEVLAIGRVTVSFDGGESESADWQQYWDAEAGIVESMTGELHWNMAQRVVTVASPRTQAVIGFAGQMADAPRLPAVTVDVDTPFVSLIFTALDGQPIATSQSVLITAMARDRQTGTVFAPDGDAALTLERIGGPPLLMEPVEATIRFRGQPVNAVRVLDIYGVPTGEQVPLEDGAFRIDGRYATYYYHVTR